MAALSTRQAPAIWSPTETASAAEIGATVPCPGEGGRLWAISDLHVDFAANMAQVAALPAAGDDALIVAGDLSHRLDRAERVLRLLTERFATVFFTAGNHDLWVDDGQPLPPGAHAETSLERLRALECLCRDLGVCTVPGPVGDHTWVVPLGGWYEPAFHERLHPGTPGDRLGRRWSDHRRCRWPDTLADDAARAAFLAAANADRLAPPPGRRVVTFSHFLPRPELLPPLEHLRFKELPRVAGSQRLEAQLRVAGASVHVFGHTHIPWDVTLDGVRYVQNPLAYPYERARRGQRGIELVRVG